MKTNLLKSFLASAALLLGISASAQTEKFYFGVTGSDGTTESTVSAKIFDNLNIRIGVPGADAKVASNWARVEMVMTDVTTLGFDPGEVRRYKQEYNTGVNVSPKLLSEYLPNSYLLSANGATVNVPLTVKDYIKNAQETLSYTFKGDGTGINGIPTTEALAKSAWQIIANETEAVKADPGEDSHIFLNQGAYLRIGNDKLLCETEGGVKFLSGNWFEGTIEDMLTDISRRNATSENKIELFLPKGSYMKVSSSKATLLNDATITLDLANLPSGALDDIYDNFYNGIASTTGESQKRMTIIGSLKLFDDIVGAILESGNVNATVQFGKPAEPFIKVYAGQETPEENLKTVEEFNEIRKSKLNAVGFVDADVAEAHELELRGVKNIVVKYPAGKAGNYYECENLVLTDMTDPAVGGNAPMTDFYSPEAFVAVKGEYKWIQPDRNNTFMCLPFALKKTDVPSAKLLIFAFEEQLTNGNAYVYFKEREEITEGLPVLVYNTERSGIDYKFDNTRIVGSADNSSNYEGTFISSFDFKGNWLAKKEGNEEYIAKLETGLAPFRGSLNLTNGVEYNGGSNHPVSSSAKRIIAIIDENGDATSIDGVSLGNKNVETIYSISGAKLSKITKPGLYIVNGVKRFVK